VRWPAGGRSSGLHCGIKKHSPDLGVILFDGGIPWAGTFTQNAAAAACVGWSRARLGSPARALVVNSGNANACTGRAGRDTVIETARAAAAELGCTPEEVLVASTGPIGVPLPVDRITTALPGAIAGATEDALPFAQAILTTDTTTKVAIEPAGDATVMGVAKGAAMLAPGMATMLAFFVTDAEVEHPDLQRIVSRAVDSSFNRISVDACESTNDSVFAFATGSSACDLEHLQAAFRRASEDLAEQMVRDAEGGTRTVRITIAGADDDGHATGLARAIASSALWRAAVNGGDPNWGRVLAAMGSVDRNLTPDLVTLKIGDVTVFDKGEVTSTFAEAAPEMANKEIDLRCWVGAGEGATDFLTTDLSPEYVTLNSGGST
jgi:glutamate N-acetyltransferase / amino-acid N-acetyltransferase